MSFTLARQAYSDYLCRHVTELALNLLTLLATAAKISNSFYLGLLLWLASSISEVVKHEVSQWCPGLNHCSH